MRLEKEVEEKQEEEEEEQKKKYKWLQQITLLPPHTHTHSPASKVPKGIWGLKKEK